MVDVRGSARGVVQQALERSHEMALVGEPGALGDLGTGDPGGEQPPSDIDTHPQLELVRRRAEQPAERAHEVPRTQIRVPRRVTDADALDRVRRDVVARADERLRRDGLGTGRTPPLSSRLARASQRSSCSSGEASDESAR